MLPGNSLHDDLGPIPPLLRLFPAQHLKAGGRRHFEDKIKLDYIPPKPAESSQLILRADRALKPGCFTDLFTKRHVSCFDRKTARSFLVPALAQAKLTKIKVLETIILLLASHSPNLNTARSCMKA